MRATAHAVARAIRETRSTILLNAALPATNLIVMRACLDAGCDYIDMASGGAENDGTPKLPDQFALDAEFRAAGRLALLGMGADPGTSNIYAAYAAKHLLDEVTELRVRDGDNSRCEGHNGFLADLQPLGVHRRVHLRGGLLAGREVPSGGGALRLRAASTSRSSAC